MKDKEILLICKNSNVTLKSTFKNSSKPVDVICNDCGLRFPVPISKGSVIKCPTCSRKEEVKVIEEIVKIDLEKVEKTKKQWKSKKSKKIDSD